MEPNKNGLTGLTNFGNTCYMNSAIQCLSNIPVLRKYFLSKKFTEDLNRDKIEFRLVVHWYKLLDSIWNSSSVISPNQFRDEVRMLALRQGISLNFVGNGQNDVQEFIVFLLNGMHNCLSKKVNMNITGKVVNDLDKMALEAMKSWKLFFKNDYSFFVDNFYSQNYSCIYDLNKKLLSATYQPTCYFTLPVIEQEESMTLNECFDLYTDFERLEGENKWYNDKTKEYMVCYKQIKFWSLPKVLIIVLKRFLNNGRKISTTVDFPINDLCLNKYAVGYAKKKNYYELAGIANHTGSLNSGHYFAYCKNKSKWYNYNDRIVEEIKINNLVTDNAYCLFYIKK
jgi:ubiquitin C-terminal hydrolase